jgi:hypothetical protein
VSDEAMTCPLCEAIQNEKGLYEDDAVKVLRTKTLKGHRERVMVVSRDHQMNGWIETYMLKKLEDTGMKLFDYTYKFVIVATDYASVPDHPHFIASDLEPGEDHLQLLGTRWIKVVDVKPWIAWHRAVNPQLQDTANRLRPHH